MSYNPNAAFNSQIRSAGNRSRTLPDLPNIGQGPPQGAPAPTANAVGLPPQTPPQPPQAPPMPPPAPPSPPMAQMGSPMQAPPGINPQTFTMSPAGSAADAGHYNYEPQPDGSWRVYPPGVAAPPHTFQASMPRAASTGDYIRMAKSFSGGPPQPAGQAQFPQPMQAPTTNQIT